ncbi:hypothetical protein CDAR_413631 [Caerostris darwini]|uniref:Uncharacterized protein n=1 Tax=Caerostris darwini TaxID=1538125 RepID=A0AAV4SJJ3_9ARAC|nr:hypothetical protein CDAR_413631 [Caerostris darwini]
MSGCFCAPSATGIDLELSATGIELELSVTGIELELSATGIELELSTTGIELELSATVFWNFSRKKVKETEPDFESDEILVGRLSRISSVSQK